MSKPVSALSDEQKAQLKSHAQGWIDIALSTAPADREGFEVAARWAYEDQNLPWHGRVIWVDSPQVLRCAAPVAALFCRPEATPPVPAGLLELGYGMISPIHKLLGGAAHPVLYDKVQEAVFEPVRRQVDIFYTDIFAATLRQDLQEVDEATLQAVTVAVEGATGRSFSCDEIRRSLAQVDSISWRSWLRHRLRSRIPLFAYTAFAGCFRDVGGIPMPGEPPAYEQMLRTAFWWQAHAHFLMVCERPRELHFEHTSTPRAREPVLRLHRPDGPAASWADGWAIHALHGMQLAAWIIEHPEQITVQSIEQESNAEVRRVLLERYGWARYIQGCGATIIDEIPMDHAVVGLRGARLLYKELPGEPEPLVYLDMLNSTPEADGTYRRYLERVDPKAYNGDARRSCHAAMASRWRYRDEHGQLRLTFQDWRDYRPDTES